MGDLFDDCIDLESQHIAEGHEDGIRDGRRAGFEEGKELGEQKGSEIGSEVGFYSGFCQALREEQLQHPGMLERVDKQLAAMEELARTFPLDDPKDDRMQDMMVDLRGKYKAICAKLGLTDKVHFADLGDQQQVKVKATLEY